ncbi:hypothetical protein B0H12DRAFT_1319345 [Mycena haematopus]|nr:hypothetical protein B0H12DRAFT_1319345 [Mycena haematopus]
MSESDSLSVSEAMLILQPLEQNLATLNLPGFPRNAHSHNDDPDGKVLQKWLDSLASLLVGSSPGSPTNQVCAVSLSLLQSSCTVTIAFNITPQHPADVTKLVYSIWIWMKAASVLPEESAKHNEELFEIILKASLDRIRRRFKDKGSFMEPLAALVKDAVSDLTDLQKTFLLKAASLHFDLLRHLGPDVEKPDFAMASKAFRYRAKAYEAAKALLKDFYWLHRFESQMKVGGQSPSLLRYMDKLQKPYSQYIFVHKALKKSFIRAALSIPLHVTVLPSPDPVPGFAFHTMAQFEERVRSYLMDALLSYSPDPGDRLSAPDVVDVCWYHIKNAVEKNQGQLPSLLTTHCECTLLCHHLDESLLPTSPERSAPYPFIGVSELSCFQCALYFQAYTACRLGPLLQTRGSHSEVFACAIPVCRSDSANEAILKEMGARLKHIIGRLLAAEIDPRVSSSDDY